MCSWHCPLDIPGCLPVKISPPHHHHRSFQSSTTSAVLVLVVRQRVALFGQRNCLQSTKSNHCYRKCCGQTDAPNAIDMGYFVWSGLGATGNENRHIERRRNGTSWPTPTSDYNNMQCLVYAQLRSFRQLWIYSPHFRSFGRGAVQRNHHQVFLLLRSNDKIENNTSTIEYYSVLPFSTATPLDTVYIRVWSTSTYTISNHSGNRKRHQMRRV